jgi:hypothetical protein
MTQADSVLSTPPTNTPVDTTRRRFLTIAAGASVASVGSLAAIAMPISTAPVSPALRSAMQSLIEAHAELVKAQAADYAANDLFEAWERSHPQPKSKKGTRRWIKQAQAYHLKVTPAPWHALMDAKQIFAAAQTAVAAVPIDGAADLYMMATCSVIYDRVELNRHNRAPIAVMVADEMVRMGMGAAQS